MGMEHIQEYPLEKVLSEYPEAVPWPSIPEEAGQLGIHQEINVLRHHKRDLRNIIDTVKTFSEGNLKPRIPTHSKGERDQLSLTINTIADTILRNIGELKEVDKSENLGNTIFSSIYLWSRHRKVNLS